MEKNILILSIFLFTFFSCSNEDETIEENNPPHIDYFNGYHINNPEGIDENSLAFYSTNDTTFISGLKNKMLWVGCFDLKTKKQTKEWNSTIQIPDSISKIKSQEFIFIKEQNKYIGYLNLCDNEYQFNCSLIISLNENDNKINYILESQDYIDSSNVKLYRDAIYVTRSYNYIIGDLYSFDGKSKVTSTTKFTKSDSTFFIGFDDEKIQIRLYNEKTKELKHIWNTKEPFNRNFRIHEGYGEYKDIYVNIVSLQPTNMHVVDEPSIISTSWGIALVPYFIQDTDDTNYIADVFILKDNEKNIFRYNFEPKNTYMSLMKWYDESILACISNGTCGGDYLVLSSDGCLISEFNQCSYAPNNNIENIHPISHTEIIYVGKMDSRPHADFNTYVMRLDYTKDIGYNGYGSVWYTKIDGIKDNGGRKTVKLIDNSSSNWVYQIEIISYNGDKQTIKFSINIDSGTIKYIL